MPKNERIVNLMRKDVVTIDKGESVEVALDLMERREVDHLVVTSNGKVVGLLSVRDIMDGLGSSRFERIPARRIYVSALMTEPPITISPQATLRDAVVMMLENDIGSLPVVDGEELVGIVTETDLIRVLDSKESIEGLVKKDHPKIMPNERIVHARSIMLERDARILPVVESGRLIGILTEKGLARAFLEVREEVDPVHMDNAVRKIIVDDVMIEAPIRLHGFVPIEDARGLFLESGLPALPTVNEEDKVIGVLERRSLLRLLK